MFLRKCWLVWPSAWGGRITLSLPLQGLGPLPVLVVFFNSPQHGLPALLIQLLFVRLVQQQLHSTPTSQP